MEIEAGDALATDIGQAILAVLAKHGISIPVQWVRMRRSTSGLCAEDDQRIRDAVARGVRRADLGRELNVPLYLAAMRARELGCPKKFSRLPTVPYDDIHARLRSGEPPADIGRSCGISRERVRQIGLKFGYGSAETKAASRARVAARTEPAKKIKAQSAAERATKKNALVAAVIAMSERGAKQIEIAAAFNVYQTRVSHILCSNGRRSVVRRNTLLNAKHRAAALP